MNELARRPSLLLAASLISGIVFLDTPILGALAVGAISLAKSPVWRIAAAASFALGLLLAPHRAPQIGEERRFAGEAVVDTIPAVSEKGQACQVESGGGRFLLYAPETPLLSRGDTLELAGVVRPLSRAQREQGAMRSISGAIWVDADGIARRDTGPWLFRAGVLWRQSFMEFTSDIASPKVAATINALCFNATSDLDDETYNNLQRSGTVHIISASGLHILIVALGLNIFLSFFPIPRSVRLILIGALLVVYAIGAGMRPPVVRSVLMAGILGSASYLRREPDLLSALGVSAFVYLLWRPAHIYDIGFQLSFVTVAAIGMYLPLTDDTYRTALDGLKENLLQVSYASLAATLASAPLTAYYFGIVSIVSVPANVLIAIALPVLTLSAFLAHAFYALWPAFSAGMMILLVQPLAGWVLFVVELFGKLSFASISIPAFSPWWMVPYYGLMLALWRPRVRPA